jgi:hypothetical protein
MTSDVDLYRERAADFEKKARLTFDHIAKIAYLELANAYKQLASQIERLSLDKEGKDS